MKTQHPRYSVQLGQHINIPVVLGPRPLLFLASPAKAGHHHLKRRIAFAVSKLKPNSTAQTFGLSSFSAGELFQNLPFSTLRPNIQEPIVDNFPYQYT